MQVEGQRGLSLLSPPATGARVSNTYATCPAEGDKRGKPRLIPHIPPVRHRVGGKGAIRRGMGMRRIS